MTRKLYRSRTDSVLAGVCGGIANYFNLDATMVRIVTFLLISLGGVSLYVYIILAIVMPKEPVNIDEFNRPVTPAETYSGQRTMENIGSERRAPVLDGGKSTLDDLQPQNMPKKKSNQAQWGVVLIVIGVLGLFLGRWRHYFGPINWFAILLIVLGILVMAGRKGFR